MAEVPIYQPSVHADAPGIQNARVEPMTPASAPTKVYEAQAALGKDISGVASQVTQHMVMQDKLRAQQNVYAAQEGYKNAVQETLADPEKGLLAKYKGVNSSKALVEFDQMRKGIPAAPGIPGTPSLRDQFMKDVSPYEQAQLQKSFDSIDSMYRGKLINHVLEQTEAANKAINEANIDSELKNGALVTTTSVHDPKDENKLIPAITLAENKMRDTITNDVYFKQQGHPPEVTKKLVQDHVNELVKVAVQANVSKNWEDAQKILDASTASPDVKSALQEKIINGARIDQYTETLGNEVLRDQSLREPDGQINEGKTNAFVKAKLNAEKDSGSPLPPGHAEAILSKIRSQVNIQNSAIDQKQKLVMANTSNAIWNAQQGRMDPTEAYDKFIKGGQFDNAIERAKANEIFEKVFSKDPSAIDSVWAKMTDAQTRAVSQIENRKDFLDKFSDPEEKKTFLNSLKQRILEGHIQNPDAINKLYMEQIKDAATGAPRFFWNWTGKGMKPQHEIDAAIQQNQPVVSAVGGLNSAATLARDLGGPDALAPDTDESKAILAMKADGYDMRKVNARQVKLFMTKYPERLK